MRLSRLRPAVIAVLALSVAGCTGNSASSGGSGGTTNSVLTIGLYNDLNNVNPFLDVGGPDDFIVLQAMYDSPFALSQNGKVAEPALVTNDKVSSDGLTHILTLRGNVKFQDGKLMTAADVVFSLKQAATGPNAASFNSFKNVAAGPNGTVVVTLKYPDSDFERELASPYASIVEAGFGKGGAKGFQSHPIGTGPYMFVSRVPGASLTFTANKYYWRGKPRTPTLQFTVFHDPNAAALAIQSGSVDILSNVPLSSVKTANGNTTRTVFVQPSTIVDMICPSSRNKALNDPAVRRAISMAIDRKALVSAADGGHGAPASTYIPPALWPTAKLGNDQSNYSYNPSAAKALLASTPYRNLSFTLTYQTSNQAFQPIAEVVQAELKQIGVAVKLQPMQQSAFISFIVAKDPTWDAFVNDDSQLTVSQFMGFPITTNWIFTGFSVAPTEAAQKAFREAVGASAQGAALTKWEQYMETTLPAIPLINPEVAYIVSSHVKGFAINPFQLIHLGDVTVSDN
jgi:peptide/nickel transport system substrate-binding protein